MDIEWWKDIPGYEGLYQASTKGRIKNKRTGRILKQVKNHNRYLTVNLSKNGVTKKLRVSRLVWSAFNGPIPEGMQINHINECIWDNRLENLNLMTPKENTNWGTGRERMIKNRKGKTAPKPICQYTTDNELIRRWSSLSEIQQETNYWPSRITGCCRRLPHFNTAYGFIWKYEE